MVSEPLDNDGNRFLYSRLPTVSYRRYPAKADLAASLAGARIPSGDPFLHRGRCLRHDRAGFPEQIAMRDHNLHSL